MNFYFKPNSNECNDLYISEWAWKPIRSMLAIANYLEHEETGAELVSYDLLKKIDDNIGAGIPSGNVCIRMAQKLRQLVNTPEIIEEFGMTVDLIDGVFMFTYPPIFCTSAMQHKSTLAIVNSQGRDDPEKLCSMLRATEDEVMQVVNFLENCNGFLMP